MTLSSNDLILYSGNIKGHVILLDWRLHVILTFSHQRTLLSLIMNNANQLYSVDWSNNSNMLISPDWWIGHHYYHMIKSSPVRVCVVICVCGYMCVLPLPHHILLVKPVSLDLMQISVFFSKMARN